MSCNIGRVIYFNDAMIYSPIKLVVGKKDISLSCQYSWSTDKINWCCWCDRASFIKRARSMGQDFYLRILFHEMEAPKVYMDNILVDCYTITIHNPNPFLTDPCSVISNSGFDLYSGWDCALMMQQQLSDQVICMLGIPVYYFRTTPDPSTKSYTFKEYVLHNVESVKQIRMLVADGAMPSSRPTISEWDLDFELDWETELSKTQFATAFGLDAYPKQRDFIWVPMQKRMYMVNTAYDEKNENLLWRSVSWKLSLVKWQDQDNILFPEEPIEDIVDNLIVNTHESLFATGEKREGEMTGTTQLSSPQYAATNLYSIEESDYIRKRISKETMKIVDRQVNHGNIVVAKNKYIFYKDSTVLYQKHFCGDSGTISIIFDHMTSTPATKSILRIGEWSLDITGDDIIIDKNNSIHIDLEGTYILILRWSTSLGEMTAQLIRQTFPSDVPVFRRKPVMYKFDFDNPTTVSAGIDQRLLGPDPKEVELRGYPIQVCNLKIFNKYLNDDDMAEILRYTSKDPSCLINDQARHLNTGHGYSIK